MTLELPQRVIEDLRQPVRQTPDGYCVASILTSQEAVPRAVRSLIGAILRTPASTVGKLHLAEEELRGSRGA